MAALSVAPVIVMRCGAVERDAVVGSTLLSEEGGIRRAAGESRVRAGSAPQRKRSGAERALWEGVRAHLHAFAVQKRDLIAGHAY